jgi:two-component system, LuxR family, sensor kinase FixL
MSIVMPVIVVLETAIILWLLMLNVLARRQRAAASDPGLNLSDLSAQYVELGLAGLGAMYARLADMARSAGPFDLREKGHSSGEPHMGSCCGTGNAGASEAGQNGARAERLLPTRRRMAACARSVRRQSFESSGRSAGARGSPASVVDRASGERYFREAAALLPVAILLLGEHGLIVMVNRQTAKLFGYECDELIGKPVDMLVPDLRFDSHVPPRENLFALPKSGDAASLHELSARRKDGTEFRVEIGLNAFRFDSDSVTLAFIIDRTDRYELRRNRLDLAHLTRVSTVGQLASSLAHELNQPLTAILSNVQAAQRFMAADPIDLAEVREILDDIVQDDYRASEVIRRIRAVVKKGDLEVAPLDLAGVIRDVVLLVHSDAILRGTRVTLDLDGNLPPVRGDRVQLQQVMLNLLLNAFDAMNDVPPVDRVVSVMLKPEDNGMVGVAVRDSGHGLTADKLNKIFKPFFTSKPQGLGLGLSISRSIIDMHRGRLWAENNIDRGATFYVTLPAGDAAGQGESRQRP